jgi:hypothetical protein
MELREMVRALDCRPGAVDGALVEERLNTYIETKPLRLVNNQQDLIFWSERTGWGHFYLYDANTGALKTRSRRASASRPASTVDDKRDPYFAASRKGRGSTTRSIA